MRFALKLMKWDKINLNGRRLNYRLRHSTGKVAPAEAGQSEGLLINFVS